MGLLAWIKKESAGEKLVARALVEFAEGDSKDALGDLVQGLIDMADGTKAEPALLAIQSRMAAFNLIGPPAPPTLPMPGASPAANVSPPAAK
jgi:hypothetical protein